MTQPNAPELLEIARLTLLEQVLPTLPGEMRYPVLMIANAMAIATREYRLEADACSTERACLAALTQGSPTSLQAARQGLAQDIRQGRHDGLQHRRMLVQALRRVTLERLTISNPKAVP